MSGARKGKRERKGEAGGMSHEMEMVRGRERERGIRRTRGGGRGGGGEYILGKYEDKKRNEVNLFLK